MSGGSNPTVYLAGSGQADNILVFGRECCGGQLSYLTALRWARSPYWEMMYIVVPLKKEVKDKKDPAKPFYFLLGSIANAIFRYTDQGSNQVYKRMPIK